MRLLALMEIQSPVSRRRKEPLHTSVQKAFPNEADELFTQAEKMAKLRYQTYVRKSKEDWSETI